MKQKLINTINEIRSDCRTADIATLKLYVTKIAVLEGFLNNYNAYGLDAVNKVNGDDLPFLLCIDDELSCKVLERLNLFRTLESNVKAVIQLEIGEIFASCKNLDFSDPSQISVLDVKYEEIRMLRYYLNQLCFYSLSTWAADIKRADKDLIRRCFNRLTSDQKAIMEKYL